MTKPIDIRQDRGTTAQSGAADLAIVGAVPATFIAAPAHGAIFPGLGIEQAGPAVQFSAVPMQDAAGAAGGGSAIVPAALLGSEVAPALVPLMPLPQPPAPGEAVIARPAPADTGSATFVPMPGGAGSLTPMAPVAVNDAPMTIAPAVETAAPVASVASVAPVASGIDPAAIEAIKTSVASLQDAIATIQQSLPAAPAEAIGAIVAQSEAVVAGALDTVAQLQAGAAETVAQAQADIAERVADVQAGAADLVAGAQETAAQTVADLSQTVAETTAAATQTVADTTAAATETVAAATQSVAETTAAATQTVADTTAAATQTVAETTATATETVAAVTQAVPDVGSLVAPVVAATGVADDLVHGVAQDFAGADPASGIQTLVGMVSAADAFGLHDEGGGAGDTLASALGPIGSADMLADLAPADILFGTNDHAHDLGLGDHDGLLG